MSGGLEPNIACGRLSSVLRDITHYDIPRLQLQQ